MTRLAEEKMDSDLQNKWADSFRCVTTCPSDQHPAYEHWEHTKGRDSAISQVPHVGAAICFSWTQHKKWHTWNHFTCLSPLGRMQLIATMRIPRNDRFVFPDKIPFFRVYSSQCRRYVRAVRGTSGSPRHFQPGGIQWFFNSSLPILYSLCVEYMARRIHWAFNSEICFRVRVTRHRSSCQLRHWHWTSAPTPPTYVYFDPGPLNTDYLISSSGMVILLFAMQSYFKSSTSLEKESVKMPPQTLDSCSFCWNESAGSKFKVVYEVRRTLNYLAFANEIGYLRMIHS